MYSRGYRWVWSTGCGPLQITRCGLEGISPCHPLGEFWRESVGVVQWVWSSGCDQVAVLKMRVKNTREVTGVAWKGTVGVVLWGSVGATWRGSWVQYRGNYMVQQHFSSSS